MGGHRSRSAGALLNVRFTSGANRDLAAIIGWYMGEDPVVAREFVGELRETIARIRRWPELAPQRLTVADRVVRGAAMKRFSHTVVYMVSDSDAWVIAIAHDRQHPDSWHDRL